jgi:hypothetical protein
MMAYSPDATPQNYNHHIYVCRAVVASRQYNRLHAVIFEFSP